MLNSFGICVILFSIQKPKNYCNSCGRILTKLLEELGNAAAADRERVIDRGLNHLPIPSAQCYRSLSIEKRERSAGDNQKIQQREWGFNQQRVRAAA